LHGYNTQANAILGISRLAHNQINILTGHYIIFSFDFLFHFVHSHTRFSAGNGGGGSRRVTQMADRGPNLDLWMLNAGPHQALKGVFFKQSFLSQNLVLLAVLLRH